MGEVFEAFSGRACHYTERVGIDLRSDALHSQIVILGSWNGLHVDEYVGQDYCGIYLLWAMDDGGIGFWRHLFQLLR